MCHKDLKNYAYVDVRPTLKSNPLIDKGGGGVVASDCPVCLVLKPPLQVTIRNMLGSGKIKLPSCYS